MSTKLAAGQSLTLYAATANPAIVAPTAPTVDFVADPSAPTLVRSSGSWTADGFVDGGLIVPVGAADPRNKGVFQIATAGVLTMTLTADAGIADESAVVLSAVRGTQGLLLSRGSPQRIARVYDKWALQLLATATGAIDVDLVALGFDGTSWYQVGDVSPSGINFTSSDTLNAARLTDGLGAFKAVALRADVTTGTGFAITSATAVPYV